MMLLFLALWISNVKEVILDAFKNFFVVLELDCELMFCQIIHIIVKVWVLRKVLVVTIYF